MALVAPAISAVLAAAARSGRAENLKVVTHARRDDPAAALIAVAQEQDADLVVVLQQHPDESLRSQVESAVRYCPAMALAMEEEQ